MIRVLPGGDPPSEVNCAALTALDTLPKLPVKKLFIRDSL